MRWFILAGWLLVTGLGSSPVTGPLLADTHEPSALFSEPRLVSVARGVALGGTLRIEAVPLSDASSTLELKRFRVFKPGARVVVHSDSGIRETAPAARAFFSGTVGDESESFAFVAVSDRGIQGLITARGQTSEIRPGGLGGPPQVSTVDRGRPLGGWTCGAGRLPDLEVVRPRSPGTAGGSAAGPTQEYAVDLALDSDWELYNLFGSVEAATDYATMLIGAASAVYQRDLSTHLQISDLFLWTTPADPWTVTSDLFEALYELGDYWHANHLDVERTTVHLLSGKPGLTGGVAYGGALCSPDVFSQGHWAGGYGLTGALTSFGTFRDTFVVSHELGHNFDSRHTHCYNGIPTASDPPIDLCFSGDMTGGRACYAGPTSLPPDGGSVMSYCHLQPGGYGNINLWLGRAGSFGERSERVLQEMVNHVTSVAGCLPPVAAIFADGFESGDASAWSGGLR